MQLTKQTSTTKYLSQNLFIYFIIFIYLFIYSES